MATDLMSTSASPTQKEMGLSAREARNISSSYRLTPQETMSVLARMISAPSLSTRPLSVLRISPQRAQ